MNLIKIISEVRFKECFNLNVFRTLSDILDGDFPKSSILFGCLTDFDRRFRYFKEKRETSNEIRNIVTIEKL